MRRSILGGMAAVAWLALSPAAGAQEAGGDSLALLCDGTDAAIVTAGPYAQSGRLGWGGMGFHEGRVSAQLHVAMENGQVRVRPPTGSIPLFTKKTKDGWYALDDVAIDRLSIRGRARFTPVDRPKLDIDRRTGAATFGAFNGICQPVSTKPEATRF